VISCRISIKVLAKEHLRKTWLDLQCTSVLAAISLPPTVNVVLITRMIVPLYKVK
jgi:hypothetical protein